MHNRKWKNQNALVEQGMGMRDRKQYQSEE